MPKRRRGLLRDAILDGNTKKLNELFTSLHPFVLNKWLESESYPWLCHSIEGKRSEIARILIKNGSKVNDDELGRIKMGRNRNAPLHSAVKNGDLELVEMLVTRGARLEEKNYIVQTPLHIAIDNEHLEIVKLLLNHGARVDSRRSLTREDGIYPPSAVARLCNRYTPLHFAAARSKEEILKLLLSSSHADVNAVGDNGVAALHVASENKNQRIAELLLKSGALVNLSCNYLKQENYVLNIFSRDFTALHIAAYRGNEKTVRVLLEHSADVNAVNDDMETALHIAARGGNHQVVRMLFQHGADADVENKNSETPLHLAVKNAHGGVVELLPETGVNANAAVSVYFTNLKKYNFENFHEMTALHAGALQDRENLVKLLLDYKADVNSTDRQGRAPIYFSMKNGNELMTKLFLEKGADVNGMALLHIAAQNGWESIVKLLFNYDADVNLIDPCGRTPIFCAVKSGNVQIIKFLVDKGSNVNAKSKDGKTALHVAASQTSEEMVELLLKCGADSDCRDDKGETPLHVSTRSEYSRGVEILLKSKIDVNAADENGFTALHLIGTRNFTNRNSYIARLLINEGACVNSRCKEGFTPLHIAAMKGNQNYVEILLDHDADVNACSHSGNTAFNLAFDEFVKRGGNFDVIRQRYSLRNFHVILETFTKFVVKMKASKLYLNEQNLKLLVETSCYSDKCEREIIAMKMKKFNSCNISFFDILTKNTNQITSYLRNKNIHFALERRGYLTEFKIYGNQINEKFLKADERYNLLLESAMFFEAGEFLKLPDCCTEKICDYLSNKDLKKLIGLVAKISQPN